MVVRTDGEILSHVVCSVRRLQNRVDALWDWKQSYLPTLGQLIVAQLEACGVYIAQWSMSCVEVDEEVDKEEEAWYFLRYILHD